MSVFVAEILIAAALFASSCVFYYQTLFFVKTRVSDIGPEYWPQILLGGLILLSVWLFVDICRRKKSLVQEEEKKPYPRRFWYTLVLAVIYTVIMPYLGFAVSTFVFSVATMWTLGFRSLKHLITVALVSSIVFIILFPKIMAVPMPRGIGIFRSISLFFY